MTPPDPAIHSITLPDDPGSIRTARDFVDRVLSAEGIDSFEARLVASELATNVVRHAHTPFTVSVSVTPTHVQIEVEDGAGAKLVASRMARDVGGLGLRIVEDLAEAWGVEARGEGKAVWIKLSRP